MGVCATRMGVHVQSLVTDRRNAKTRTWVAASSAISVAPMHDRPCSQGGKWIAAAICNLDKDLDELGGTV